MKNRATYERNAAVLALLAERWPACLAIFEQRRRPLKVGIHHDIIAALDGTVTAKELSAALRCYTGNAVYRSRLRAGVIRVDLDGRPAGEVTAAEAAQTEKPKPATNPKPATAKPVSADPNPAAAAAEPAAMSASASAAKQASASGMPASGRLGLADLRATAKRRREAERSPP